MLKALKSNKNINNTKAGQVKLKEHMLRQRQETV